MIASYNNPYPADLSAKPQNRTVIYSNKYSSSVNILPSSREIY